MKKTIILVFLLFICSCTNKNDNIDTILNVDENSNNETEIKLSYKDISGHYSCVSQLNNNKYDLYLFDNGTFVYDKNDLSNLDNGKYGEKDGLFIGNFIIDGEFIKLNNLLMSDYNVGDLFIEDYVNKEEYNFETRILIINENNNLLDTYNYKNEDISREFIKDDTKVDRNMFKSILNNRYVINTKWINNIGYK